MSFIQQTLTHSLNQSIDFYSGLSVASNSDWPMYFPRAVLSYFIYTSHHVCCFCF